MKRYFFLFAALLVVLSSCNYNPVVTEAFTKYKFKNGVTTVTVPGWLINLGSRFGELEEQEREILESIDKVKVLAIEDDDLNGKVNLHKEFYNKINKKGEYEQLLSIRNEGEEVTIFGKMEAGVIKEMVILVGGNDNVMVYLKGEIKPELLDKSVDFKNPEKLLSFNF